ncbi:hypothetical protein ACFFJ7_15470 [Pseudochelatococcus lubricantis]|uniref:hypothetical protein n=1 Tax=Pseudochelatococcus lubricantis TaxID=1538102 RepID=UPI0035E94C37
MPHILVIGYDPDSVDYSDPGTPAGLDKEKVWAGTLESLKRIRDYGWQATQCMVKPDRTAADIVSQALSATRYDCIVIGGGVRLSHKSVPVFEIIVDTVRRLAPGIPLAFNEGPATSLESAQRWLGTNGQGLETV